MHHVSIILRRFRMYTLLKNTESSRFQTNLSRIKANLRQFLNLILYYNIISLFEEKFKQKMMSINIDLLNLNFEKLAKQCAVFACHSTLAFTFALYAIVKYVFFKDDGKILHVYFAAIRYYII